MMRFKKSRHLIPFNEYLADLLVEARHIREVSPGKQRYSGAQYEMALVAFGDIKTLKKVIDKDMQVDFSKTSFKCDYLAGFDWLDLSVGYQDQDAIAYFQEHLQDENFSKAYNLYKNHTRPDCKLQDYELNAKQLMFS